MNLIPMYDRVIVEKTKGSTETTTSSGIVVKTVNQHVPDSAVVVAVGPGMRNTTGTTIPLIVKIGDTVLINKNGGQPFEEDGKEYLMMREIDIIGIRPSVSVSQDEKDVEHNVMAEWEAPIRVTPEWEATIRKTLDVHNVMAEWEAPIRVTPEWEATIRKTLDVHTSGYAQEIV
jgi:chaperonin GroES